MLLEYLALALWCFAVALAGGLVGLVLGNLRLPLVVLLASSPAVGAGTNLAISALAAATAALAHVRAGRINPRLFAWMAPPSVAGAVAGGLLSGAVSGRALLLGIAGILLYSGIDLLRRRARVAPAGGADAASDVGALDVRAAVVAGGAIGLLGGFVGLILGSLRMPALLRLVHEGPARAVGTNLAIGFCVGRGGRPGPPARRRARRGPARRRRRRFHPRGAAGRAADRPARAGRAGGRNRGHPPGRGRGRRRAGPGVAGYMPNMKSLRCP